MLEMWPVTRTNSFKEFLLFFPTQFARPFRFLYRKLTGRGEAPQRVVDQRPQRDSWVNPIELLPWSKVGHNIVSYNLVWLGALTVVMVVCGWGVTKCETSINLMRFFADGSKIRRDYAWLEQHLGPLVPMEVVVRFSPDCDLNMLERMELVERVHRQVETLEEVGSAMSPATFVPPLPGGSGYSALRVVWKRKLENGRAELLGSGYLTNGRDDDAGEELWRVSARVQALKDMDYGAFFDDIRAKVDPVVQQVNARETAAHVQRRLLEATGWITPQPHTGPSAEVPNLGPSAQNITLASAQNDSAGGRNALLASALEPSVEVVYTGLVPLVYKAQRSLMEGLKLGFVGDWILIAIVMMIVVRDVSAGFLLMIPSAFPALVVFGVMGMMGIVVDTGTVMAPAVALGVTVDDVVHYMLKFADKIRAGGTRREAIMAAYGHCAQPIYQSWGVIGLGLAVFALSHFMPTQRFGWMMVTLLTASTIGNLTLLPAILASPLGAIFAWSVRRHARKKALREGKSPGAIPADGDRTDEPMDADILPLPSAHDRPVLPHTKHRDTTVRHDAPHTGTGSR